MYTKMEILTDSENVKKNWEICQKLLFQIRARFIP